MTFDSLTFARRLKTAGFTEAQAEALADANREMVMPDLATKADLKSEIAALETRFQAVIENQTLRLTVRLGVMIAAGVAILGAIQRMH